jgi:hypothetical protein
MSKHIEVDVHYIRDQLLSNNVTIAYGPTSNKIADYLTKALTTTKFSQVRNKLGVVKPSSSLRGAVKE